MAMAKHRGRRRAREAALRAQMRAANEQLVLASMRADELVEQAKASERVKDEFLAMLGHELRNPLSPILSTLELMAMRSPDAFVKERALIERQVKHMVRLVDDLLDVSRIASGKIVLSREPVELYDVVRQAVELVRPLIDAKRHALSVGVSRAGLVVDVDPSRLAQIIANLLANAGKYTPVGGIISVTAERRDDTIAIAVEDNGIGISKEMLPRVFDLFAQERQALDRAQGGLGLGLAIVKTLVALHGGNVTVTSAGHEQGSRFVVELPAALAVLSPPVAAPETAYVHHKILVVDDNTDSADLTALVLAEMGHEVRVAYDGPSAIATVGAFVPDVALLDIGLPGMTGYELATELDARIGHIRFIAMSGYGQPRDRDRSRDAGFASHLVKPVTIAVLRDAVEGPTSPCAATAP
jgi:CheY-like chemotaxis protein